MTTIVNTPPSNSETNSGISAIVAVAVLIGLIFFAVYFGAPLLRRATAVPQVNIPDKIDVNVNTSEQ